MILKNNYFLITNLLFLLFFLLLFQKANSKEIEILNDIPGNGIEIINHSKVKVHYEGRLEDGTIFDSSYKRKEAFAFQIGVRTVIEGWEIGLIGMKLGGKRTLIIPPEYAYGKNGVKGLIPSNSKLIFDIEVIDVEPPGYKLINPKDLKKKMQKGFIVIDIRSKKEIQDTGSIEGAIQITAFSKNGKLKKKFLETYQKTVSNTDNVVFVSDTGEISSILANGFTEYLDAKNMYSLRGGIKAFLKLNN